jgi:predicted ferric reductase
VLPDPLRTALRVVVLGLSAALTGWLLGTAIVTATEAPMSAWVLGRSAGISSYLLLTTLVITGLLLAHPRTPARMRMGLAARVRLHAGLAAFTLVFTVLHVVVLATDPWAGVGWWGALVPMGSTYRPLPVTLGVLALYAGLAAGLSAALAGRLPVRVWWPLHKIASAAFVLVWWHGVLAGADTPALLATYAVTGIAVVGLAVSRYATEGPRDRAAALARVRAREHEVTR